jgi:hypothetical protein
MGVAVMDATVEDPHLALVPVTLAQAKRFVDTHHRHNAHAQSPTWKFGVGLIREDTLVGVAMAGLPKARMLMDTYTLEVNRTCTDGTKNANSMLYGAIARAAKALGYRKLITYTLPEESGASLKAAGWTCEDDAAGDERSWATARASAIPYEVDLFGTERVPTGRKMRWVKELNP